MFVCASALSKRLSITARVDRLRESFASSSLTGTSGDACLQQQFRRVPLASESTDEPLKKKRKKVLMHKRCIHLNHVFLAYIVLKSCLGYTYRNGSVFF